MKYICENSLYNFPAWKGGKDTLNTLIETHTVEQAEQVLNEIFDMETPTEDDINNELWYNSEYIYERIGLTLDGKLLDGEIENCFNFLEELCEKIKTINSHVKNMENDYIMKAILPDYTLDRIYLESYNNQLDFINQVDSLANIEIIKLADEVIDYWDLIEEGEEE